MSTPARGRPFVVRILALALAHVLLASCATPSPPAGADAQKIETLLVLIREHLEGAAQSARSAWLERRVADDAGAEAALIEAAINRAREYALPPETVRDVLRAQFDASRSVRQALHSAWDANPAIRPQPGAPSAASARTLNAAGVASLLGALAQAYPVLRREGARDFLESRANTLLAGVPGGAPVATAAIAPLWRLAK